MRISRWIPFSMLVVVLSLCAGGVAEAQDENQHYRIRARHSDKCLDVSNVSISNGEWLQQWGCWEAGIQLNQTFNVVPAGNGSYRIVPIHSVKCVDITGTSSIPPYNPVPFTDNSALAQQWECNTSYPQVNQTFYFVASEVPNYFRIKPVHSGRCLDVSNLSQADGALVQQWDCAPFTQDNQLWRLETVGPRIPRTNVQYLGYFGGPPVGQVSDHTNWLEPADLTGIDGAVAANMGTVLPTEDDIHLFNEFAGTEGGDHFLKTNAQTIWQDFVVAHGARLQYVTAFRLADEPFWNGFWNGYTDEQVRDGLEAAAQMIKATYPNKKVIVNEAFPYVNLLLPPPSVDWIGFQCYTSWDNCEGNSIPNYFNMLKNRVLPHQKLFLMPWSSFFRAPGDTTAPTPAEIQHRMYLAERYVEFALTEPRVVALLNWTAPFQVETGPFVSPELMAKWRFLGRALGFGAP